mmetsp:Transcript_9417/g.26225  ORF Transcript_9417/g.26225 Transcript_9417/m.26225 type:complete len:317 (+) Transcript_9417:172-1122(+)
MTQTQSPLCRRKNNSAPSSHRLLARRTMCKLSAAPDVGMVGQFSVLHLYTCQQQVTCSLQLNEFVRGVWIRRLIGVVQSTQLAILRINFGAAPWRSIEAKHLRRLLNPSRLGIEFLDTFIVLLGVILHPPYTPIISIPLTETTSYPVPIVLDFAFETTVLMILPPIPSLPRPQRPLILDEEHQFRLQFLSWKVMLSAQVRLPRGKVNVHHANPIWIEVFFLNQALATRQTKKRSVVLHLSVVVEEPLGAQVSLLFVTRLIVAAVVVTDADCGWFTRVHVRFVELMASTGLHIQYRDASGNAAAFEHVANDWWIALL